MNLKILFIYAILTLSAACTGSGPLPAEDRDWQSFIQQGKTTVELNARADEALLQLRKRMNDLLSTVRQNADTKEQALLQSHQEAWELYAETKARYLADSYRSGSLESVYYEEVLIRETQRRIHELQELHTGKNRP